MCADDNGIRLYDIEHDTILIFGGSKRQSAKILAFNRRKHTQGVIDVVQFAMFAVIQCVQKTLHVHHTESTDCFPPAQP